MANGPLGNLIDRLRQEAAFDASREVADDVLLRRFVRQRDADAFAVLMQRHGPMVLGVCRSLLRNHHDAEDAFQATFLVLARKASSVRLRGTLAPWLSGVSYRVARKARSTALRRQRHEMEALRVSAPPRDNAVPFDTAPAIHEEVQRLPERYRAPVILCYLQGETNESAARQLGCPVGTVKGRLSRARTILEGRLTRRGLAPAGGILAVLAESTANAAVPWSVKTATLNAAVTVASGQATIAAAATAPVAALTTGVLRTMFLTKLTVTSCLLIGVGVAGLAPVTSLRYTQKSAAEENNGGKVVVMVAQADPKPTKEVKKVPGASTPIDAKNAIPAVRTQVLVVPKNLEVTIPSPTKKPIKDVSGPPKEILQVLKAPAGKVQPSPDSTMSISVIGYVNGLVRLALTDSEGKKANLVLFVADAPIPVVPIEAVILTPNAKRQFVGKSNKPIERILFSSERVLRVEGNPVDPRSILLTGLAPGYAQLNITDASGNNESLYVIVEGVEPVGSLPRAGFVAYAINVAARGPIPPGSRMKVLGVRVDPKSKEKKRVVFMKNIRVLHVDDVSPEGGGGAARKAIRLEVTDAEAKLLKQQQEITPLSLHVMTEREPDGDRSGDKLE